MKSQDQLTADDLGVVVIGRNEGLRLDRCLDSVAKQCREIVYVDSGSTDSSATMAENKGINTLRLDASVPFTAARARNVGFEYLCQANGKILAVQFVDGDCELSDGWLERALHMLRTSPQIAVVCGVLCEADPAKSIYHRLCDMEWDKQIGEIEASGGICMIRAKAFKEIHGFDPEIQAGEEPDLCMRLRYHGWKILRIAFPMARHDANMLHFTQWWSRMVRGGYAFAQGAAIRGKHTDVKNFRQCLSIWFWTLLVPTIVATTAWVTYGLSLSILLAYPLQILRIATRRIQNGSTAQSAYFYGLFCLFGKWPQLFGQIRYYTHRIAGQ